MYKKGIGKKDIVLIIIETLVVVLNIVITWVFGASKIASTILWLLVLWFFVSIVFIYNSIENQLYVQKKQSDLLNHLYEENMDLYKETIELKIILKRYEKKELEQHIQDTYNPPVDENN